MTYQAEKNQLLVTEEKKNDHAKTENESDKNNER